MHFQLNILFQHRLYTQNHINRCAEKRGRNRGMFVAGVSHQGSVWLGHKPYRMVPQ